MRWTINLSDVQNTGHSLQQIKPLHKFILFTYQNAFEGVNLISKTRATSLSIWFVRLASFPNNWSEIDFLTNEDVLESIHLISQR